MGLEKGNDLRMVEVAYDGEQNPRNEQDGLTPEERVTAIARILSEIAARV